MIGKLKLLSKENKILDIYSYENLSTNKDLKNKLREKLSNGCKLVCCCNNENIEMKISSDFKIYPAHHKDSSIHSIYCPRSKNYSEFKSKYVTGWKQEEDSEQVNVKIKFSLKPPSKNDEKYMCDTDPLRKYNYNKEVDGKITLLSLMTHLNLKAWNKIISRDNKVPIDKYEFLNQIYGSSQFINIIGTNKTLQELMFKYKRDKNMKSSESRFVYGYIDKLEGYEDDENYKIIHIKLSQIGNPFKFKISKELLENSKKYPKIKNSNHIAVAGFVSRKYNSFEFFNFAMININERGLFSESSHEIKFYNLLCNNNIPFKKPNERLLEYGECIPDGIIEMNNKIIFIEIFGFNSDDYNLKKERKIKIMEELKDTHSLLQWDTQNAMPSIEEILEKIK